MLENNCQPIYNKSDYAILLRATDKIGCVCSFCDKPFFAIRREVTRAIEGKRGICCSVSCASNLKAIKRGHELSTPLICTHCKKEYSGKRDKRAKNNFCSKSCAATYNNINKQKGTTRSKLEGFIQDELSMRFPDLAVVYNEKTIIGSELDIYIPKLKLAFELNGIFHYEPIYGKDKLEKIQNNDDRKFQACLEKGISLCIIDTSSQSYVTKKTSKKYIDIVLGVIEQARIELA